MSAACAHKLLFVCLRNGNGLEQGTGRRRYAWPAVCRRPNKHCIELVRTSLSTSTSRSKETNELWSAQIKWTPRRYGFMNHPSSRTPFFQIQTILENFLGHRTTKATSIFKVRRQSPMPCPIVSLVM